MGGKIEPVDNSQQKNSINETIPYASDRESSILSDNNEDWFTDKCITKLKNHIIDEYGHTFDQAVAETVALPFWSHWPSFDGLEYVKLTGYIESTPFELVCLVGTQETDGKTVTVPRSGDSDDFIIDLKVVYDENGDCWIVPFNAKYNMTIGDPEYEIMPFSAKYDDKDTDFEKCCKIYSVICAYGKYKLNIHE